MGVKTFTLLALLCCLLSYGQITVTGIVLDPSQTPLVGATIQEIGTDNFVYTGFDGDFIIDVQSSSAEIQISAMGFQSKIFTVNAENNIVIKLSGYAANEYLDSRKVNAALVSGILHNPVGSQITITSSHLKQSSLLQLNWRYQTNLDKNQIISSKIGIRHIRFQNLFDLDISATYMNVRRDKVRNFQILGIETVGQFGDHKATLGVERYSSQNIDTKGPKVGYATYIYGGLFIDVSSEVTFYKGFNSYDFQVSKSFNKLNVFINYQKVQSFQEISIGLGYTLFY